MCGIVGFIGQEQAAPILLDGLAHLEYRGYDSAGVAVISAQGKLQVEKAVGRLKVLSEQIHGGADLEGCIGLGHTRWATHGAPNIINSHPHVSENGKFAVIHNGIIENYVEIKEFLIGQGIRFKSETDTEVVAQLLEFYYNECHDFLEAVGRVLRRIEGAYALGMLCADCPDRIIAARKDAPLLLGYGKGCNFLASDVTAIIKHTRDVAYMEDGEVAVLTREGIEVYDALEQKVEKKHFTIDWEVSAAEKGGYQHFMLKEIMEQPEALRRAISPRIKDGRVIFDDLKLPVEKMREFTRIFIVACGSSYHVGMIGKYNLEHLLRRNVEVVLASEFRYSDPIVDDKSLVIVISQSGETLDTMAALREAKKRGGYILSIVNVVGSSIARESDDVLYTWAGPEIAVATTKAYSTQLAVLDMIGLAFGEALGTVKKEEYNEAVAELQKLPEKMEQFLASESCEAIPKYASQYFNHNSVFFIGRNLDYALGLEGSLKLKEISYIHSEAYASGELKHGTISLIEDGTLVIALGTYAPLFDKAMSNVVEVKARGADVLALATESHRGEMAKTVENVITIPDTAQMLLPSLGVVPLQLLAYYIALQRGCDIDKPRNLAKSVTVE
ncbi:MAG: glutamine--fructose-6-phosphate transaminase (isomerizing) [Oscillibacter sp.]|jgi:glucosamine--fructose-6-phosphate aminotransferase (isomerizing)|nr:glutamine--fructose-6-phosphate transaminase (isomerizing) [Bacillota bacterium]MCC2174902.1 glutamine--fructose-6-phosphate transaminase (isomerizing) [Hominicoprocola fusiformis]MCI7202627.1 glutamine--fructose-6-phosphate transaminase (isomerizing) [Oscillibacter sp.]RHU69667.1 glutamine--fructose-6-phosphate transaminase (isomerizing) [Ruminococcaceae bacterium TF06-43]HJH81369.1 glutamine--fructose-6-phosphate transaminase (isomerizing) [Clostridiales bacterium]